MEKQIDKIKGIIYGQAIGDALGLGTEGMTDEDMAWKYPNGIRHYDPRCVGPCVIVSKLIHSLVYDNKGLTYHQMIDIAQRYDERIREFIDLSMNTDIRALELQDDDSVGYTLRTLAAGLWAYWNASSFEEGLLAVVHAGGDADTNAAVACAILGAKYGYSSIPQEYVEGLIYKGFMVWNKSLSVGQCRFGW